MSKLNSETVNCFSVDVEDYFQVSAFDNVLGRDDWESYDSRVESNTDKILRILESYQVRGTFFILGWIAKRYPDLVRRIDRAGHEIASHGFWHRLIYEQTPDEFAEDLRLSQDAIGSVVAQEVVMYRAPSFSVTKKSLWALDILSEQGIKVDSSIFPISGHDRYGIPGAKREIHTVDTKSGNITEFPPSAWHLGKINIPIGGGYFRILPFSVTRKAIQAVNQEGRPAMFYIHPWEVDPEQPRLRKLPLKSRVRHYTGLHQAEGRLAKLLSEFKFSSVSESMASVCCDSVIAV